MIEKTAMIVVPGGLFVASCANVVVATVFGRGWGPAAPLVGFFALAASSLPLATASFLLPATQNRPRNLMLASVIEFGLVLGVDHRRPAIWRNGRCCLLRCGRVSGSHTGHLLAGDAPRGGIGRRSLAYHRSVALRRCLGCRRRPSRRDGLVAELDAAGGTLGSALRRRRRGGHGRLCNRAA